MKFLRNGLPFCLNLKIVTAFRLNYSNNDYAVSNISNTHCIALINLISDKFYFVFKGYVYYWSYSSNIYLFKSSVHNSYLHTISSLLSTNFDVICFWSYLACSKFYFKKHFKLLDRYKNL